MTSARRRFLAAAAALTLGSPALAEEAAVTLLDALALAREQAPALAAERAVVAAARGDLAVSRYRLPEEPVLELEAAGRSAGGSERTTDFGVALSQRFEVAGQRRRRMARAASLAEAVGGDFRAFERDYLAAVARAYLAAAAAGERLELAARAVTSGREADAAAALRHEIGDIALLERNLAAIELSRLEAERWRAESEQAVSRLDLAALLGADAAAPLRTLSLEQALQQLEGAAGTAAAGAVAPRPELVAARARIEAQEAEVSLRRAERVPDLVATVGRGREEGSDRLTRFGVALSVPLWRRNRGEIAVASAELERRRAALAVIDIQAARELGQARARSDAAAAAVQALGPGTADRLEQNLRLAGESFEAGKIGLVDLLFVRRSGIEAQRLLVDARLDLGQALIEARRAAGLAPLGE